MNKRLISVLLVGLCIAVLVPISAGNAQNLPSPQATTISPVNTPTVGVGGNIKVWIPLVENNP